MSKQTVANMEYKSQYHKEFIQSFKRLAERHGRSEVWSDFINMYACAISNSTDRRFFDQREALYMECIGRYNKEERDLIVHMTAQIIYALDLKPDQDFLGEIFGALNLHNEWRGQFFTPYHMGELMVRTVIDKLPKISEADDTVGVTDPCCGAGCLLIACANEANRMDKEYQKKLLFYAQDIDRIAALMCYIQLSLLGCRAIVKIGNSLTDPFTENEELSENIWISPMQACGGLMRAMHMLTIENERKEVS